MAELTNEQKSQVLQKLFSTAKLVEDEAKKRLTQGTPLAAQAPKA